MKKIRKKVVREKAVIAIYQYVLIGTDEEEVAMYLQSDAKFVKDKDEYDYCLAFILAVIRNHDSYQKKIESLLKTGWTTERLSKMELAILLVAVHEMLGEQTDKKVVINEAVEMSKKYCDDDSYRFINGILNQVA